MVILIPIVLFYTPRKLLKAGKTFPSQRITKGFKRKLGKKNTLVRKEKKEFML